ncbi:DUF3556 domain-containing protein [uncultured Corynebacterium sp.]|uniref:DUF3556 domain-containing protein n=1 Tax=uncultured Corynebacterium sp. TaxID=159447 RepID=UPI0025E12CAD|nr:DUF3556 domain-containing protein [uncultured Corynebacterium sp.]
MGLKDSNPPPVDPATFLDRPFSDRIRATSTHWTENGLGTPKMINVIYLVKVLVLHIIAGVCLATLTSGMNPLHIAEWWDELIVYQKLLLWTFLLEGLGLGGSWGPLAGHFSPMTGGFHFWLKPGTIRLAPWPDKVPFTRGDTRTVVDVAVYAAVQVLLVLGIVWPATDSAGAGEHGLVQPAVMWPLAALLVVLGLRDKIPFLGARAEQYLPAVVFFAALPFVDMIIALKLLIVVVWVGAGVSKFGHHFSMVIPPMMSNTPWLPFKAVKRMLYRNHPHDLRPAKTAVGIGHVLGTLVEVVTPVVLLFSTNLWVTVTAAALMVCFHLFIFSTFPLAVPLEWNILFAFTTVALFVGHPAWDGFAVTDAAHPWAIMLVAVVLLAFPVLGNLRPDLVSFLPSARQYAGNWAAAVWAFAPGAEEKLDEHVIRGSKNTRTQLLTVYPPEVADILMHQLMGWRSLHSQGRGLFSVMHRELGRKIDTYSLREAEFACNSLVAFNFGDGHFHDKKLIDALQRRCNFLPGEFIVVWVESQPIHRGTQEYMVIDAAVGVIERGTWKVADAVAEQPWLPNGPIPVTVTERMDIPRVADRDLGETTTSTTADAADASDATNVVDSHADDDDGVPAGSAL